MQQPDDNILEYDVNKVLLDELGINHRPVYTRIAEILEERGWNRLQDSVFTLYGVPHLYANDDAIDAADIVEMEFLGQIAAIGQLGLFTRFHCQLFIQNNFIRHAARNR